jgi:hypothetical protein
VARRLRYAEMAGDGTLSMLGVGQDIYFVPDEALPATMGTFLAVRIAGGEDEWIGAQEHRFALKVIHPEDLSEEDLLEIPLKVDEFSPLKLPGHEVVMTIPVIVQFEARGYGEHSIQAFIDDVRSDAVVNISIRQPPSRTSSRSKPTTPNRLGHERGTPNTPNLQKRHETLSGRWGSNPRPSAWEADALPTELRPRGQQCSHFFGS